VLSQHISLVSWPVAPFPLLPQSLLQPGPMSLLHLPPPRRLLSLVSRREERLVRPDRGLGLSSGRRLTSSPVRDTCQPTVRVPPIPPVSLVLLPVPRLLSLVLWLGLPLLSLVLALPVAVALITAPSPGPSASPVPVFLLLLLLLVPSLLSLVLRPRSLVLYPLSLVLYPPSLVLYPPSLVLYPPSLVPSLPSPSPR
jgi:hypothetical protein